MMKPGKFFCLLLFSFVMNVSYAQPGSAFYVGLNTLKPLSNKDFIQRTSSSGVKLGFTKLMNEKFGFGIDVTYNTLKDYVPLQTYEYPGGAITIDVHNYMYYFTIMGSGQYYIYQGKNFIPYASLGMGVAFTEYRIFYNVYEDGDQNQAFAVRPEIGTFYKIKENSRWGLKASASYEYSTNKTEYFGLDNFSGINFLVGVVFFTD